MADLIDFTEFMDEPELDRMDWDELHSYLEKVQAQIAQMDEKEPKNMNSEAYESWAERHEDLEDLEDEILDRMDELKGPNG